MRRIVDCLNDEFGNYAYFEQPDSQTGLDAFIDFCGGESDTAGYLRSCQDRLAAFDAQAKLLLNGKDTMEKAKKINTHVVYTKEALAPAPAENNKAVKVTLDPVDNSKATANAKKNTKDDMYKYIQSYYGFTDDEMEYLKGNYPNLLTTLYNAQSSSTRLELRTYERIRKILDEELETEYDVVLPETVIGKYSDGSTITFNLQEKWGVIGNGNYPNCINKDSYGRYRIAVGPRILDPDYPDDGKIGADEFDLPKPIDLYVKDKKTGEVQVIHCVVADVKAHTYNNCSELSFEGIESGYFQSGIPYPNAYGEHVYEPEHVDGSVIEFCGHGLDFNINDYTLEGIKINEEE